jgi:hypothetical protein
MPFAERLVEKAGYTYALILKRFLLKSQPLINLQFHPEILQEVAFVVERSAGVLDVHLLKLT